VLTIVAVVIIASTPVVQQMKHNSQRSPTASQISDSPTSVPPAASANNPTSPAATRDATHSRDLQASFVALEESVDADIGVAVGPAGATGETQTFGLWTSGPAWSTSKVPLVMAAMRERDGSTPSAAMQAVITESDNQAAEQIWENLGEPASAAQKVEAVLRETGDPTVVQSHRTRPQYTAFGQTIWSLADQEHFLARAACDTRNGPVLEMMSHIEDNQRWGLGIIDDAKFKGGWGPSTTGNYLVRQFGLIPTPNGTLTVAVAAEPSSGSFDDGIAALTTVAKWLSAHLQQLPGGNCPPAAEHP
jgi:hypothetical protein